MHSPSARNFPRVGRRSSKKAALLSKNKFWNEHAGYLADVIDCDHRPGMVDLTFRPNQIFAVGGLPLQLLLRKKKRGELSMRSRCFCLRQSVCVRSRRANPVMHSTTRAARASATPFIIKAPSGRG